MTLRHLAAAAALLVAACEPLPDKTPPDPARDACGAAAMQDFVGQNESVLMATTFAKPVRFLRPGMAVTMDFVADRLNFVIDERGRITRVYCG